MTMERFDDDGMRQPDEPVVRGTGNEILARKYMPLKLLSRAQGTAAKHFSLDIAVSGANKEDAEMAARLEDSRQVAFGGENISPNPR